VKGLVVAVSVWLVVVGIGHAAPRKVLVLPLDGSIDPTLRSKLNTTLAQAARGLGGAITVGDTTFEETAIAIGCDAAVPACAEHVRTTLGYDVLVWGTVSTSADRTVLVVRRASAGSTPRTDRVELTAPEQADDKLGPVFGRPPPAPAKRNVPVPPPPPAPEEAPPSVAPVALIAPVAPPPAYDNSKRNRGIVFAAVGGGLVLAGIAVWSAQASTQDAIDSAPTNTADDFRHLEDLEGRARNLALAGDLLVVGGIALGGYGAWVLYQDRAERRVVVVPRVTATTAGLALGGRW
jgi:hypothetical protein